MILSLDGMCPSISIMINHVDQAEPPSYAKAPGQSVIGRHDKS